ncbi:hypothetical protein EFU53_002781 [Vibrio cholerae]|uniref:hypothetical protein n=1 Tax=Vibrio cholerae TaxID=666 RepID=UPI000218FD6D|nr:hypothetical protein [Vibrio cholerae]EGR10354.1 hypothetical protein VCHE48_1187 [Vibrio cholerae HE48]EKF9234287.1 hypothetical protein [Vibrio cholerae]
MTDKYEFLNDVAAIELVNQIAVASEKAQVLKRGNVFSKRIVNLLTGSQEEHQNDFNVEVSGAIESLKNEVLSSNTKIFKNASSIKKMAGVLIKNKQSLSLLESDVSALQNKVSEIEFRLEKVEARQTADDIVEEWKVHCSPDNSILFETIRLVQMLYWSDFSGVALVDEQVKKYGYNRCMNAIMEKFSINKCDLVRQAHLAKQFDTLEGIDRDALAMMIPQINSQLSRGYEQKQIDELLKSASLTRIVSAEILMRDLYEGSLSEEILA